MRKRTNSPAHQLALSPMRSTPRVCTSVLFIFAELVGLSLVQKAPPSDDNSEYIVFVVHDIVLDYLQQHIQPEKQARNMTFFVCFIRGAIPYFMFSG